MQCQALADTRRLLTERKLLDLGVCTKRKLAFWGGLAES